MKLSDVKGERVFEVMADLVEPVCNIATSESLKEAIEPQVCPKGMKPRDFAAQRLKEAIPAIIREHHDDIASVLATIKGVDRDEYTEDMTLISLWSDVMELVSDGDFLDFLASLNVLMDGTSST